MAVKAKKLERFGVRIRRELKEREAVDHKERLATIDAEIVLERQRRAEEYKLARLACGVGRAEAKAAADLAYQDAKAQARAAKEAHKEAERERCSLDKARVREEARARLEAKKKRRAELRRHRETERRLERAARHREKLRSTSAERKSESDDAVRANLEPFEIALFEKVKAKIKGSELMSRTEAFQHYMHEHPHELQAAIEVDVDAALEREARKREGGPSVRGRKGRKVRRAAGASNVPF